MRQPPNLQHNVTLRASSIVEWMIEDQAKYERVTGTILTEQAPISARRITSAPLQPKYDKTVVTMVVVVPKAETEILTTQLRSGAIPSNATGYLNNASRLTADYTEIEQIHEENFKLRVRVGALEEMLVSLCNDMRTTRIVDDVDEMVEGARHLLDDDRVMRGDYSIYKQLKAYKMAANETRPHVAAKLLAQIPDDDEV